MAATKISKKVMDALNKLSEDDLLNPIKLATLCDKDMLLRMKYALSIKELCIKNDKYTKELENKYRRAMGEMLVIVGAVLDDELMKLELKYDNIDSKALSSRIRKVIKHELEKSNLI